MPITTTRHHCRHARGGHARSAEGESGRTRRLDGCWRPALISETQPQRRVRRVEARAMGPFTTISTEPLTWAISCVLLFSTDQHYTPHAELGHFMALFTQSCLSCLPSTFLPGAIYPQHHLSRLIKVLLIRLQADARLDKSWWVKWTKTVTQWS